MKKTLAIIVLLVSGCSGCTVPSNDMVNTCRGYNLTSCRDDGYVYWGCGGDYTFHSSFSGINQKGESVHGVMCCGYMKGCTVKF